MSGSEHGMKQQREQLRRLQDTDRKIRDAEERRARSDEGVRQAKELVALRKENLNTSVMDQKVFQVKLKEKELELEEKEQTTERLRIQLNTARSNREYATFQHEIAGLRADASLLEDESLQMMEDSDLRKRDQKLLSAEIRSCEEEAAAIEFTAREEAVEIESDIRSLTQERKSLCEEIAPETLDIYERLLRNRDGRAVVPARNSSCTGCHMTLTQNTISLLRGSSSIVRCHSCGRILYLPDEEE